MDYFKAAQTDVMQLTTFPSGMSGWQIRVRGTVQGVGFRPTVWRLAQQANLVGHVCNDAEGVLIQVQGAVETLQRFLDDLSTQAPPLAHIETIEHSVLAHPLSTHEFSILSSRQGRNDIRISADAATCPACRREILSRSERHHFYPFTNCTHCGPRLTIVKSVPYDRATTSMAAFSMCDACREEYQNPADRRFHAQPIACHQCGPHIWLEDNTGQALVGEEAVTGSAEQALQVIQSAVTHLRQGNIVAIRGLGGFHLAVDAHNAQAVQRLRQRKHRYSKPLALMVDDIDQIEHYCDIQDIERQQLTAPQAPIVLLPIRRDEQARQLPAAIAPQSNVLGFMMAYSPLHILLCREFGSPLVMTSGNLSEEPQITSLENARRGLAEIADCFLMHNREIANRVDDSVVRYLAGDMRLLRRARGYAPSAIPLPEGFEGASDILAYGGELKSTFCLLKEGVAIVSQHQGDLEDPATFDDFEHNLSLYLSQYQQQPTLLVCDQHPEYLSTKLAQSTAIQQAKPFIQVQHHHAHIASCLADNRWPLRGGKVLGIALDGLGYGSDKSLWGGELLLADYCSSERLASFDPIPMLGGAKAIKEPWRNSLAAIEHYIGWESFLAHYGATQIAQFLQTKPVMLLQQVQRSGLNSPAVSSCGRLFDAVAATLGLVREQAFYEGEGAIALEMQVTPMLLKQQTNAGYDFAIERQSDLWRISAAPMWRQLLDDLLSGMNVGVMATRFHLGLAKGLLQLTQTLSLSYSFSSVALSGGCLQNKVLAELLHQRLQQEGFEVLQQRQVPANDGGLSLGQAVIAAAQQLN